MSSEASIDHLLLANTKRAYHRVTE